MELSKDMFLCPYVYSSLIASGSLLKSTYMSLRYFLLVNLKLHVHESFPQSYVWAIIIEWDKSCFYVLIIHIIVISYVYSLIYCKEFILTSLKTQTCAYTCIHTKHLANYEKIYVYNHCLSNTYLWWRPEILEP